MPDVGGVYSLPPSYFVRNGDDVLPSQHNPPFEDVAAALNARLLRNGTAAMTGDLQMNNNRIVGLQAAVQPHHAPRWDQVAPINSPAFTGTPKVDAVNGSLEFLSDTTARTLINVRQSGTSTVQVQVRADGKLGIIGSPLYVDGSPAITEAADLAKASGDVGTYVFCRNDSGATIGQNGTVQGSKLSQAGIGPSGSIAVGAATLTGTWRCHGYALPGHVTQFKRIA